MDSAVHSLAKEESGGMNEEGPMDEEMEGQWGPSRRDGLALLADIALEDFKQDDYKENCQELLLL